MIRVTDPCKPLDFDLSRPLEIEVGCGKGGFLTRRAKEHPECDFLGIERMLERVRLFDGKCRREKIANANVLRLEALYTFHYLLPAHHARTVYVFFPDPWPKKKHHSHRLFGPLFLNALWKRLEIGGKLEFATDHKEYFETVCKCFEDDSPQKPRFERVEPMPRPKEVWTEFETMFREQGLPIYSAAWKSLPGDDEPLKPLTIPPEAEPREGIKRRTSLVGMALTMGALLLGAAFPSVASASCSNVVFDASMTNGTGWVFYDKVFIRTTKPTVGFNSKEGKISSPVYPDVITAVVARVSNSGGATPTRHLTLEPLSSGISVGESRVFEAMAKDKLNEQTLVFDESMAVDSFTLQLTGSGKTGNWYIYEMDIYFASGDGGEPPVPDDPPDDPPSPSVDVKPIGMSALPRMAGGCSRYSLNVEEIAGNNKLPDGWQVFKGEEHVTTRENDNKGTTGTSGAYVWKPKSGVCGFGVLTTQSPQWIYGCAFVNDGNAAADGVRLVTRMGQWGANSNCKNAKTVNVEYAVADSARLLTDALEWQDIPTAAFTTVYTNNQEGAEFPALGAVVTNELPRLKRGSALMVRAVDPAGSNANAALGFADFELIFSLRNPFAVLLH